MLSLLVVGALAADLDDTTTSPFTEDQDTLFVARNNAITRYGFGRPAVAWRDDVVGAVMLFETYLVAADGYTGDVDLSKCEYNTGIIALGRATSADGITWNVSQTPGVLPVPDSWFGCGLAQPALVDDDGTWHLFFKAIDLDGPVGVGHAVSDDGGFTFTFEDGPALLLGDLGANVYELGNPTAVRTDDGWLLLVERVLDGAAPTPFAVQIVGARSADGVSWTMIDDDGDAAPDVLVGPGDVTWAPVAVGQASLTCETDPAGATTLRNHFGGGASNGDLGFGEATSADGTTWTEVEGSPYYRWSAADAASYELVWWAWNVYHAGSATIAYFNTWDADGVAAMGVGSTDATWSWEASDLGGGACVSEADTDTDADGDTDTDTGDTDTDTGDTDTGDTDDTDTDDTDTDDTDTDTSEPDTGDPCASGVAGGGGGLCKPATETECAWLLVPLFPLLRLRRRR